ncbi:MAG: DNA polymerase III subunit gamma/tau [Rhodospirillales bacterium]|nr:DNA polymerase III subunit gamma/tau [Rhodospirillales bacterium]
MSDQENAQAEYRVLARKYRPTTFEELIGQEAMVRTLTNAIDSGRLAHAFVMTGVRGIGKTTTARLIARALNCIGADGQGGATISPCGVCEHCKAIAEDRHVDIMELDAASRTGVDDIREIIEGVRYRPTSARYKIYIIDEVHMLSRNAFNALLKTLEEPPEHVKFIFATTEIRKIPITVLSRCQRFDLRRVEQKDLITHFAAIAEKENAKVTDGALAMISRAADGSVRDGLSLLDQAIAHCASEVNDEQVRDMLGLADRAQTFDLLDKVFKGEIADALDQLNDQYNAGADPLVALQDMLELTHWLTRLKVSPKAANGTEVPETERVRGMEMAEKLPIAALTRTWQMLLKGIQETTQAPSPLQAAEMILVRLAYAADLPTPGDAVKMIQQGSSTPQTSNPPGSSSGGHPGGGGTTAVATQAAPMTSPDHSQPQAMLSSAPQQETAPHVQVIRPDPQRYEDVVSLTNAHNERILHANLVSNVHLVSFEPGKIEFNPTEHAPEDLAAQLARFLNTHTDRPWTVTKSRSAGEATLHQKADAQKAQDRAEVAVTPLVMAITEIFPGATIGDIRDLGPKAAEILDNPDEDPENDLNDDLGDNPL